MTRLEAVEGTAVPLPIDHLDTDQIMPKQFLRIIDKAGLADGLLYDLRFDAHGAPRAECVLNRPAYRGARILVGGVNFGCGSSREHAVWGLRQYGFDAVIAPSFAEIFHANAMNNRLAPIVLPQETVRALAERAVRDPHGRLRIDLNERAVVDADGHAHAFELSPRHARMLIEGVDTIDLTLASLARIEAFEARHFVQRPWVRVG